MNTPEIQPMRPTDKPAVMAILRATPEFLPHEVVVAEELIDAFLTSPRESGYYILVAEQDGQVAGYICYGDTPLTEGTWDIYWIAVDSGQQGKGIGKELMTVAENDIEAQHGRLVVVETSGKPNYNKTRQFYASGGYTEAAHIPDFYAPGDDKLILIKRLS